MDPSDPATTALVRYQKKIEKRRVLNGTLDKRVELTASQIAECERRRSVSNRTYSPGASLMFLHGLRGGSPPHGVETRRHSTAARRRGARRAEMERLADAVHRPVRLPRRKRERILSLLRSLTFTGTQGRSYVVCFRRMDKDNDGKLGFGDFCTSMRRNIRVPLTEAELGSLFAEADANSDGYVDLAEFVDFVEGVAPGADLDSDPNAEPPSRTTRRPPDHPRFPARLDKEASHARMPPLPPDAGAVPAGGQDAGPPSRNDDMDETALFNAMQLSAFYADHAPHRASREQVRQVLARWRGREDALGARLAAKYGSSVQLQKTRPGAPGSGAPGSGVGTRDRADSAALVAPGWRSFDAELERASGLLRAAARGAPQTHGHTRRIFAGAGPSKHEKRSPTKIDRVRARLRALTYVSTEGQNCAKAFRRLDKDLDGYLSYEDFATSLKRTGGVQLSPEEMEACFDAVDTDGNGVIEFDEFVEFVSYSQNAHVARV
jgi:Ca2+-binding EF-hand superfamily protein